MLMGVDILISFCSFSDDLFLKYYSLKYSMKVTVCFIEFKLEDCMYQQTDYSSHTKVIV